MLLKRSSLVGLLQNREAKWKAFLDDIHQPYNMNALSKVQPLKTSKASSLTSFYLPYRGRISRVCECC